MMDDEANVPQDGETKSGVARNKAQQPQPSEGSGHESTISADAGRRSASALPYVGPSTYLRPLSRAPHAAVAGSGSVSRIGESEDRPMTPLDKEQIEGLVSALHLLPKSTSDLPQTADLATDVR